MSLSLAITRRLARLFPRAMAPVRVPERPQGRPRVLVAGVYVGDRPNCAEHLVAAFAGARHLDVEQRWACARGAPPSAAVAAVTVKQVAEFVPKWTLLAELIGADAADRFDYVLFSDDDVRVGDGFLDGFVALQQRYGFALAQPARTWASWTDWPLVRRRLLSRARETSFVESGPVVSMSAAFLRLAMPFSDESPMGWGYDLVWPALAHRHGLTVGIVDATPVDHSLRARGVLYGAEAELARMSAFLATREHVSDKRTLRSYRR